MNKNIQTLVLIASSLLASVFSPSSRADTLPENHLNSENHHWLQIKPSAPQFRLDGASAEQLEAILPIIEQHQAYMTQFFQQLEKSGIDLAQFKYQQQAFQRIKFGLLYSQNANSATKIGIPILAVTPDSLMASVGLMGGDIITQVNGVDFTLQHKQQHNGQWLAATQLTKLLSGLTPETELNIQWLRNGQAYSKTTTVKAQKAPAFITQVIAQSNNTDQEKINGGCGRIQTIDRGSNVTGEHPIKIIAINGELNHRDRLSKLEAGTYQLKIRELISDKRLSNSIQTRYRDKLISLELKPNELVTIKAKINEQDYRNRENYWQPLIESETKSCEN